MFRKGKTQGIQRTNGHVDITLTERYIYVQSGLYQRKIAESSLKKVSNALYSKPQYARANGLKVQAFQEWFYNSKESKDGKIAKLIQHWF